MSIDKIDLSKVKLFPSVLTGEALPFKTPSSAGYDEGSKIEGEDKCRLEDFEPISACIARFLRNSSYNIAEEYAYDAEDLPDDLDVERPLDSQDGDDVLERQVDLEDYLDAYGVDNSSEQVERSETTTSKERAEQSDERGGAPEATTSVDEETA